MVTDGDFLIVRGKSFQYLEAVTVKVLSPAKVRVTEYVRRRGSFDDLKFLIGVYKFKQVSRYFGRLVINNSVHIQKQSKHYALF